MTDHTRHSGIFAPLEGRITLIGAGGIGALTAVVLAKMSDGELEIWDADTVDPINIATQYHTVHHIGMNKAAATAEMVSLYSDSCEVGANGMNFPGEFEFLPSRFVVSAVDSIKSRKAIWAALKGKMWEYYLDARMSAEVFQLYTVSAKNVEWYEHMLGLQDDAEIADIPCTAKATIYTAAFAAGHIGKTIRELVTGKNPPIFLEHDIIAERITVAYGTEGHT